jgi:hypothetical protein
LTEPQPERTVCIVTAVEPEEMVPSQTSRILLVGTPVVATLAVVALTGWLVGWPLYRDHLAVQPIVRALKSHKAGDLEDAVEALKKTKRAPLATRMLIGIRKNLFGWRPPDQSARWIRAAFPAWCQ